MGRQITQLAALKGFEVNFISARGKLDIVEAGLAAIRHDLQRFAVDKGKMSRAEMAATIDRIHLYTDLGEAVRDVQLVSENVREDLAYKQQTFKELGELSAPGTILATDSSGFMVTMIGTLAKHPERIVGIHFFNPVAVLRLVEIVNGARTSLETCEAAKTFAGQLGKETITVKDSPGYVVVRLFMVLINEAAKLVQEGVCTVEEIDKGCQLGLGHAMGPLRAADLTNAMSHAIATWDHMRSVLGDDYRACQLILEKHFAGETGDPAGKGFYDHSQDKPTTM
jgi:3-hydroxybutyryl-CoA dehydrogenase